MLCYMMSRVLGIFNVTLTQGQIMYFLVKAYAPKPLHVASYVFAAAYDIYMMWRVLGNICVTLTPRSR